MSPDELATLQRRANLIETERRFDASEFETYAPTYAPLRQFRLTYADESQHTIAVRDWHEALTRSRFFTTGELRGIEMLEETP